MDVFVDIIVMERSGGLHAQILAWREPVTSEVHPNPLSQLQHLPQFSAVSLPLLVSSGIELLTKTLASHHAMFGENRYLAVNLNTENH